jgi:hypothetical protein
MNHGTGGYRQGCRCDTCRDAANAYQRQQRRPDRQPAAPARLLEPRPYWFQFASCRPEYADRPLDQWVDLFFPTRGESTREAKEICAECPAQEACLDHGMAAKHGIWGGSSERERRRLRRHIRLTAPA